MNWRKKVLLLVLAVMVLFSSVSCGQSDKGTTAKSPGPESTAAEGSDKNAADTDNGDRGYDLNPVGQLPIAKETAPLSIMLVPDAFVEDYDTNSFTKYVEDACNFTGQRAFG